MREKMKTLVYEVFIREERQRAELRLTEGEAACLSAEFFADCRPVSGKDSDGKVWYEVEPRR